MEIKLLGKLVRATQSTHLYSTPLELVEIKPGEIFIIAKEKKEEFHDKFYTYQVLRKNRILITGLYPMSANKEIILQNDDWSWNTKPTYLSVYFEIVHDT